MIRQDRHPHRGGCVSSASVAAPALAQQPAAAAARPLPGQGDDGQAGRQPSPGEACPPRRRPVKLKKVTDTEMVVIVTPKGKNAEDVTFIVEKETKIMKGGKVVAVKDVMEAETVTVTYAEADGKKTAKSVTSKGAPAPPPRSSHTSGLPDAPGSRDSGGAESVVACSADSARHGAHGSARGELLHLLAGRSATPPAKVPLTPSDVGLEVRDITIDAEDGVALHGWLVPRPGAPGVVVLHGYPAEKAEMLPIAATLAQHFSVLLMDLRYFGKSGGDATTFGVRERGDLRRAVDVLMAQGTSSVGVFGLSLGGAVAILTAAEDPRIRAIAAYAPYLRPEDLGA